MEKLATDKRSSLLQKFGTYGRKKFYDIGPSLAWQQSVMAPQPWMSSGDNAIKLFMVVIYECS
jgi:hypothetical protein